MSDKVKQYYYSESEEGDYWTDDKNEIIEICNENDVMSYFRGEEIIVPFVDSKMAERILENLSESHREDLEEGYAEKICKKIESCSSEKLALLLRAFFQDEIGDSGYTVIGNIKEEME